MSNPEQDLHNEFCLYGAHYLKTSRASAMPVDPKVYETIYKYLEGRNLETMPEPEEDSLQAKELAKLKEEMED